MGRIIGMTFPSKSNSSTVEPGILTVLPQGDNVEYSSTIKDFDDKDVDYYLCSVYASGIKQFKEWAKKHDKSKIVVGGYDATTAPEIFIEYAHKIVQGFCDDFYETMKQKGPIVRGIVSHKEMPRYDLWDYRQSDRLAPDLFPGETAVSICTSQGCTKKCSFCQSPPMSKKIISKPLDLVQKEINYLKGKNPKVLFVKDVNFTALPDWKGRLKILNQTGAKIEIFAAVYTLNEEKIKFLKDNGVYLVYIGIEDLSKNYPKNNNVTEVYHLLKKYGIYTKTSLMTNPLLLDTESKETEEFNKISDKLRELKPEVVLLNCLMPFYGTVDWEKYKHIVTEEMMADYEFGKAALIKDPVRRKNFEHSMFKVVNDYYTSQFYKDNVRNFHCGDNLQKHHEIEQSKWAEYEN